MQNFRSSEHILSQIKAKPGSGATRRNPGEDRSPEASQDKAPLCRLVAVILQIQDVKKTIEALSEIEALVIQLPSTGALLGQQNATLLIGLSVEQVDAALEIIRQNCRQRQAYVSVPMEGAPLPVPAATPVTIGGATVFTIEVERFEEF